MAKIEQNKDLVWIVGLYPVLGMVAAAGWPSSIIITVGYRVGLSVRPAGPSLSRSGRQMIFSPFLEVLINPFIMLQVTNVPSFLHYE